MFPFDLAFAMTVYKAQGQTLPKVVLCLMSRPVSVIQFDMEAIYVALSRVKQRLDIRILYHSPNPNICELEYLATLKPNDDVHSFLSGFHDNNNSTWDGQYAYRIKRSLQDK